MQSNEQLINGFYSAFQKLDAAGMNACYSNDIIFSDPAFGLLKANEVKAMWEMLCRNAKDFSLTFGNITALDHEYYTCDWTASYTFSKTGRKVVNKIKAHMRIADGKIIEHSDAFSLHRWCAMALGFPGWLFGWSGFFQNRVRKQARVSLEKYMGGRG